MSVVYVAGDGVLNADIMLVGEAPGQTETLTGKPFTGLSGAFLKNLLIEVGYKQDRVYITNVVKVRPPDNRRPTDIEVKTWKPILLEEIKKVSPKVIVTLGVTAFNALLDGEMDRSKVYTHVTGAKIFATYHPAYCRRFPKFREHLKNDLKQVLNFLSCEPVDKVMNIR